MAFAIRSHFLSSICGESSISCLRVSVILRLSCLLDTSLNTLGWAAKRLFSSAVSSWKNKKINWKSWKALQKKNYYGFPVALENGNTVIFEKWHWNFYYVWISGRAYSWVPNRYEVPNKRIVLTKSKVPWRNGEDVGLVYQESAVPAPLQEIFHSNSGIAFLQKAWNSALDYSKNIIIILLLFHDFKRKKFGKKNRKNVLDFF